MRTHYKNGDEIQLTENGCDGCSPAMVNGVLCHESGCPDSWRDHTTNCRWCGTIVYPHERNQQFCDESCMRAYYNLPDENDYDIDAELGENAPDRDSEQID